MFSDTTQRIAATAFRLDPQQLLMFLAEVAQGMEDEKRERDLTIEAERWSYLSDRLVDVARRI